MTLSENGKKNLRLSLICLSIAVLLELFKLTNSIWISMFFSFGIGFSIRYGKIWLGHLDPQMSLPLQYLFPSLVALVIWGIVPISLVWYFLPENTRIDLTDYLPSLLLGTVAIGIVSYLYYRNEQAHILQQALDKANLERVSQEKEMLETRLRLLQSQIEPHFLFNTLANIQALISIEPAQASKMLTALTALLRQSLNRTRQPWLTLGDELRFNKAYLAIQQIRLGDRLQVKYQISDKVSDNMLFPPMLLQPLVENAVVHGIEPLKQGGELRLSLEVAAKSLKISLYNDCAETPSDEHRGHQVGLANAEERLAKIYGCEASFSFTRQAPSGFLVNMEVPLNVAGLSSAHRG